MTTNQVWTIVSTGVIGGIIGWGAKWFQSWFDLAAKRRDALEDQLLDHVAKFAPTYDLMSNHAFLLSKYLINYLEAKLELQLTADATAATPILNNTADNYARDSLYFAAKLYTVIVELFWVKGGKYYLPEPWAGLAMMDLHVQMVNRFHFSPEKLDTFVKSAIFVHDFGEAVEKARNQTDTESAAFVDQVTQFRDWLKNNDREVRELAAYALAYSELFEQQMGNVWKKRAIVQLREKPVEAPKIDDGFFPRLAKTGELVGSAAAERVRLRARWTAVIDPERLTFNELFGQGWTHYEAERYDLALMKYKEAGDAKPGSAETLNNIANVHLKLGRYGDAETNFRQAIAAANVGESARVALFRFNLGVMWSRQAGEKDVAAESKKRARSEAIAQFEEAVRLAPEKALYRNELGNAYYWFEQFEKAAGAFTAALEIAPGEPVIHGNLGDTCEQLKDLKRAKYHFGEAAARMPAGEKGNEKQKANYLVHLASLLEQEKNFDDARTFWKQALECDSGNTEIAWALANSYQTARGAMGEEDQRLVTNLLTSSGTPEDLHRLGAICFWRGDYLGALDYYSRAVRAAPRAAGYQNDLGLTYRKFSISDKAFVCYQTAFALDPKPVYRRNLALTADTLRLYDFALVHLKAILEVNPDDADCKLAAAECYAFGGENNAGEGLRLCAELTGRYPDDPRPHQVAAKIQAQDGKNREAMAEYKQAYAKSTASDKKPLLEEWRTVCDRALAETPEDAELYYERGGIFDNLGLYSEAKEAYEKARSLGDHEDRYKAKVAQTLGNLHYKTNDYAAALKEWESALTFDKVFTDAERARLINNIGTALDGMGQQDKASKRYAEAADLARVTSVAQYNLGIALYRSAVSARVLAQFEESDYLQPPMNQPPYQIGNCFYRLGRKDLARIRWEEALRRDADYAEPLSNLGVLDYESGQQEAAVKKWKRAIQINPKLAGTRRMLDATGRGETPELCICEPVRDTEAPHNPL